MQGLYMVLCILVCHKHACRHISLKNENSSIQNSEYTIVRYMTEVSLLLHLKKGEKHKQRNLLSAIVVSSLFLKTVSQN